MVWGRFIQVFPAQAGVIPFDIAFLTNNNRIPRASGGDPAYGVRTAIPAYVFPAQAGVIPGVGKFLALWMCIPRASGGDPL